MSSPPLIHLQVAEVIISTEPVVVATVLGSCVSVCVYCEKKGVGGITHFALPRMMGESTGEDFFRYGENAIPYLIEEVRRLAGVSAFELQAKLVGGAEQIDRGSYKFSIGKENIAVARQILEQFGVPLVSEDVSGVSGRKLLFHTASGRVQVKRLSENNLPQSHLTDFDLNKILCIGASTGGTEAIREVITGLPALIPPTLVVQHIPAEFSRQFAERLNSICRFEVREARDCDEVRPSRVLIAPGGKQMKLQRTSGGYRVRITDDIPVNRHKPSVDYLFQSVASIAGAQSVGVILTGMGADGAQGLVEMRRAGAHTIVQDESSSVVFGMPRIAIERGAAARVVPLRKITSEIIQHLQIRSA